MATRALNIGCLVIILLLVVPVVGLFAWFATGGRTSGEAHWPDYYEVEQLFGDSDLVVVGTFLEAHRIQVEIPPSSSGAPGIYRRDVMRDYEVVEVLSGEWSNLELLTVWNNADHRGQEDRTAMAVEGETYVLFLQQFVRDGEPAWGRTGEPGIARLEGERLVFLASGRYEAALRDEGLTMPDEGSIAPFSATLTDLRELDSPE